MYYRMCVGQSKGTVPLVLVCTYGMVPPYHAREDRWEQDQRPRHGPNCLLSSVQSQKYEIIYISTCKELPLESREPSGSMGHFWASPRVVALLQGHRRFALGPRVLTQLAFHTLVVILSNLHLPLSLRHQPQNNRNHG